MGLYYSFKVYLATVVYMVLVYWITTLILQNKRNNGGNSQRRLNVVNADVNMRRYMKKYRSKNDKF